MTEEDEEFERIEREVKIKGQPYHFKARRDDDDDIQDYVRPWVGLTDEERKLIRRSVSYNQFVTTGEYAEHVQKATEAKLREKNT